MDLLISQTRARFDAPTTDDIQIAPIEKGGSDRRFYRVRVGPPPYRSLILAKYTNQKEENRHYVRIAQFLEAIGVRAPKIFFHDEVEGLIWMEDLGTADLWSFRQAPWPVRRAYYQSTLDEVRRLHDRGWEGLANFRLPLQMEFNVALYRWEQNYFFENCLGRYFENLVDPAVTARVSAAPVWEQIATRLAAWPRVLVHRDFQSQNVLVKDEQAHLIDFQGMRPGLAHYDLASLLYDPYAQLAAAERDELLDYYLGLGDRVDLGPDRASFDAVYTLCALQRLMQALGAYGFLGLVKGKTEFLGHVPVALAALRPVAARIPGLDEFSALLAGLPA